MAADPNVVLLLHLDGSNGSTSIVDSSSSAKTGTANSSSLSTAQQKFGTASWATNTNSSINYADSADWHFGAGQFTVECWVRFSTAPTGVQAFCSQWGSQFGWFFGLNNGVLSFFYSPDGTDNPSIGAGTTVTTGVWYHFAADRDASNVLRVYQDGVVIALGTVSSTFFNSSSTLRIGNDEATTIRGFTGWIDEVRITKGVARYAGAFTPPTAAFPDTLTDIRNAGTVREVLVAEPGNVRVAGVVREILIQPPLPDVWAQGLVRETVGSSEGEVKLQGLIREAVVMPAAAGPTEAFLRGLTREVIVPGLGPEPSDLWVGGIAREAIGDNGTPTLGVGGIAREVVTDDYGAAPPTVDVGSIARETIVWRAGEAALVLGGGMAREVVLVPGVYVKPKPRQYAVPVSLGWPG